MQKTVFDTPLVAPLFRWLAGVMLFCAGWSLSGEPPKTRKYVLIAAPHTSNWDFPLTLALAFRYRIKIYWMGKDSLFRGAAGPVMRWLGGIPVERSSSNNMVEQVAAHFASMQELIVTVPPEGTRSSTNRWKSGFYHIAHQAGVPIALGFLDYKKKCGGFLGEFMPSGDFDAELPRIQAFYKDIVGKNPRQFSL